MSTLTTKTRWRVCLAGALSTALLVAALPALAQDGPEMQPSEPPPQINKAGEYSGVTPGDSPYKPARKNLLSWVGFQPGENGARVFAQLSNEVTYDQHVENGALVVKLEGVRYRNRNVSRRLDTRFFETIIRQVTSKRVSKRRATRKRPARTAGIELRIEFKNPADAQMATATMRREKDGYYYLYLDFPPPAGGSISISQPE